MLTTPMGKLDFYLNDKKTKQCFCELPKSGKGFHVDARYFIAFLISETGNGATVLEHKLKSHEKYQCNKDTGENHSLMSYYGNGKSMNISFVGDISGVKYEYLSNNIRVSIPTDAGIPAISCIVVWKSGSNSGNDNIETWLAADPYTLKFPYA